MIYIIYDKNSAVQYALKYALEPNNNYIYYQDNDCTNFISQCLRAGGAQNDFNTSHPWWYNNGKNSICWSVAHSLFWYIRVCTQENRFGIKANTYYLNDNNKYKQDIEGLIKLGDIIQYKNYQDRIQHSTIITGFDNVDNEPLVSQHTFEGRNVSWRKNFKQVIFHHITSIN
ncbi:amidase domain-containing protein [Alkalibaculum sporogenes]|uniref:amidase domain-containing protein n=1 Tax=Alkalibaculum sporogenes TaxID=2655001 RepID=UPI0031B617DB